MNRAAKKRQEDHQRHRQPQHVPAFVEHVLQRGELVLQSFHRIVRQPARGAAKNKEPTQRDHEGLDLELRHQQAVDQADRDAQGERGGDGRQGVPVTIDQQHGRDRGAETDDRADREVDAARDDQTAGAEREDAVEPDSPAQVEVVRQRTRIGVGKQQQNVQPQQKQGQAEQLFHGTHSPPVAKCITACSDIRSRGNSPASSPWCITSTRSLTPRISSRSLETISTPTPSAVSSRTSE